MLYEVHFWMPGYDCDTGLKSEQKIKDTTLLKLIHSRKCDVMIQNLSTEGTNPICWIDRIGGRFRQR
jgi:hypothetical protein